MEKRGSAERPHIDRGSVEAKAILPWPEAVRRRVAQFFVLLDQLDREHRAAKSERKAA